MLLMINLTADTLSETLINNSRKSNLYFPGVLNADNEKVPLVTITLAMAKTIFDNHQLDSIIASVKLHGSLKDISLKKKIRKQLA